MSIRSLLISVGSYALVAIPFTALAATTNFFGPVINQKSGACVCAGTAMDWGCVIMVFQNVLNLLVSLGVLAVVFFIGWAGFTLIVSGSNPAGRTKAKNRFLNAVVGLVVILAAWLIVNTVMTVLYNPSAVASGVTTGNWTAILSAGTASNCLNNDVPTVPQGLTNGQATGGLISTIGSVIGGIANPGSANSSTLPSNNGPAGTVCDPSALQSAVPGMSTNEANTLACIAKPESGCGTTNANYKMNNGSSAYGPFQVLMQTNAAAYNNAACEQAVGASGPLNCASGFKGGNPIPGSSVVATCEKAAATVACSAAAADYMYNHGGPSAAWTADPNSSAQKQCIAQFSGI